MRSANPVEHGEPHAIERRAKPLRRLPAMRMRDEEIAAGGPSLEVFQIADQHFFRHDFFEDRRLRGRHRRCHFGAHFRQPLADSEQKIRFGAERHTLAAEMEMPVEHGVDQLAALAPELERDRSAADPRKKADEVVIRAEAGEALEELKGNARARFER